MTGLENIPVELVVESQHLKIVHSGEERDDDIADLRFLVTPDDHKVAGIDPRVDHGLAFGGESEQLAFPHKAFGHADVFCQMLFLFLAGTARDGSEHRNGDVRAFGFHPLCHDGSLFLDFHLDRSVVLHFVQDAEHRRNGDPRPCGDVADGRLFVVLRVVVLDESADLRPRLIPVQLLWHDRFCSRSLLEIV